MADLTETSTWVTGIYQLERTDLWDAGTGGNGVANLREKQLANRTLWLKDEIAKINAKISQYVTFASTPSLASGSLVNANGTAYGAAFPLANWDYFTPNDGVTRTFIITITCFANFTYNASGNVRMGCMTTVAGPTVQNLAIAVARQPYQTIIAQKVVTLPPNTKIVTWYENNATGATASFTDGSIHIKEV